MNKPDPKPNRPGYYDQIRRLLKLVEAGETEMADAVAPVPIANYSSAERYAEEQAALFRRMPVIVATSDELKEPGASLAHDDLGLPVVLMRGEDGVVRGFLNVCRHRNTRLLSEAGVSCVKALKCPYHNWVYGLDGSLKAVPQEFGFPGLDRAEFGLVPVPVEEKHGLVWLVADKAGAIDIDAHLGEIGVDLESFGFADHVLFRRERHLRKTNWKLIVDAFLEIYHVKRLHKETLAPFFTDNQQLADWIGPHVRMLATRDITMEMAALDEADWRMGDHVTFAYLIFPSTIMVVQPDFLTLLVSLPQGPGETLVDHIMLIPQQPRSEAERAHYERAFKFFDSGVFGAEDLWVAEQGQAVIDAGANEVMTLGRFEHSVGRFHEAIDEAIAEQQDAAE